MIHILGYLRRAWKSVLLIFILLIFQASCDLSLPQFTSKLVNVGIQQNGIEHVAPTEMRQSTMEALQLFLNDDQKEIVQQGYTLQKDQYIRVTDNKEELQQLDQALQMAMVMLDTISEKVPIEQIPEQFRSMDTMAQEQSTNMAIDDSAIAQKAIQFTQKEYIALGYDIQQMQMNYLMVTGGKMLLLSLGMVIAAILAGLVASRTAAELSMYLREQLFVRVVAFGNEEMTKFSTASLITRSTNDIQQIQMVIVILLRMVLYAPILGIGGVFRVMRTATDMAWIIAVAVAVVMGVVAVLMAVAMPRFKKMQTLIDDLNLVAREILTGLSVIRAFSREKHEEERFDQANVTLTKTQLFTNRVMTFMMPTMMLIMNVVTVAIVWFGAQGIDLGTMQVGDMMAFITYTMQIIMSFLMISMISILLPRAGVAADRIHEVLTTEPRIGDKEKVKDDQLKECYGEVVFDDVSFRYPDAQADVLEHISFTARPGQTTAIIGSTGSGKSSLLNLIPRFFDVSYGRITIDGIDIRDLSLHRLHEVLGYVPQKGILFSGNIESNLKFGGEQISDEQMKLAAQIAQATEFIESKPEHYQTPIAQGGTNVSGGQKQRLSIARAIAKNPKIYLFDDSFSALDYKTDATLRRALNDKIKDATMIVVAQRISTILHAEQIIVLNEGKIAGIGTHEELMQTCQTYQEIARSQLSEKELGGMNA